jgi:hypothetical protein
MARTNYALRQAAGVRRAKEASDVVELTKIVRMLDKASDASTPTVQAYDTILKAAKALRRMREPDLNKLAGQLEQGAKGLKDAIDKGSRSFDQIERTVTGVKKELQQEKTGRDED